MWESVGGECGGCKKKCVWVWRDVRKRIGECVGRGKERCGEKCWGVGRGKRRGVGGGAVEDAVECVGCGKVC